MVDRGLVVRMEEDKPERGCLPATVKIEEIAHEQGMKVIGTADLSHIEEQPCIVLLFSTNDGTDPAHVFYDRSITVLALEAAYGVSIHVFDKYVKVSATNNRIDRAFALHVFTRRG